MPRPDPRSSDPRALKDALREADPEARLEALGLVWQQVTEKAEAIHPDLAQAILDRSDDSDHRVRAAAVSLLGLIDPPVQGSLQVAASLLTDEHSRVRQEACAALGDMGDRSMCDALAERLEDADPQVGFEAAFALASLGDGRGRAPLEAALGNSRLRLDAMKALGRLGDPEAGAALERFTGRFFTAWVDRLTAWATLHLLGRPDAGDEVLARTAARSSEERAYALSLIGSHRIATGRARLEEVALDPKDQLREVAIRALGELGDPESRPVLDRLAADADPSVAEEARAALAASSRS